MTKSIFQVIIILYIIVSWFPSNSFSKEKIIWPYVCFKPLYICQDDKLVGGSGYDIVQLLWKEMVDYEHTLMLMPIKRIIESAKEGQKQLFYGLYKTPERQKFLEYSLPCRISTPTFLVIRKSELANFSDDRTISLQDVLDNKAITFLYLQSVSFGQGIDELLDKYKENENILREYDTSNLGSKSLKLLMNKRVDAFLSVDGTRYDAAEIGAQDEIAFLSINEQNQYDIGYITAPKNEWGKKIIRRVNSELKEAIEKDTFFSFFTPLVDKAMIPQLRKQYEELILTPARQATTQ